MKMNITIEIDSEYLPHLYAVLNNELKAAKELVADEKFVVQYPNLTKNAQRTVDNLSCVCDKLLDEF